jgi:hypothetical protein
MSEDAAMLSAAGKFHGRRAKELAKVNGQRDKWRQLCEDIAATIGCQPQGAVVACRRCQREREEMQRELVELRGTLAESQKD